MASHRGSGKKANRKLPKGIERKGEGGAGGFGACLRRRQTKRVSSRRKAASLR